MHNGEQLDDVRAQLGAMLDRADELPDGRRIFKTEDGKRVCDEHGFELPSDVIDPHAIDDHRPRWEPFQALKETEAKLQTERRDLLEYQDKLDQTRARLGKGSVTTTELEALESDLNSTMPPSVRDNLGHRGTALDVSPTVSPDPIATIQHWDNPRSATPIGPSPI